MGSPPVMAKNSFIIILLYKGNLKKKKRKSSLIFFALKSIHKLVTGIHLHSSGPKASFDTHIAILYMTLVGWLMDRIWHLWQSTFVMSRYGNMGVKRCFRTSGMQTNAINQVLKNANIQNKFSKY